MLAARLPDAIDGRSDDLLEQSMATPIGLLRAVAGEQGLVAILWPEERHGRVSLGRTTVGRNAILREVEAQIAAYFAGRLRRFDLPLDPRGTQFQRAVWAALAAIPYGETRSYRDLAAAIGQPSACRAVGAANGRNPLSIVVPCHRVIGSGGALTGFAGGLEIKHRLLALEGALSDRLL